MGTQNPIHQNSFAFVYSNLYLSAENKSNPVLQSALMCSCSQKKNLYQKISESEVMEKLGLSILERTLSNQVSGPFKLISIQQGVDVKS